MKKFNVITPYRLFSYMWILLGHVALVYLVYMQEWNMLLLALVVNYVISQIGISLTYHRALAHRSIKLPTWLEVVGTFVGGFALQGSPLSWSVVHRTHHKHTATDKDPHSPKFLGNVYLHIFGYVFSKSNPKLGIDLAKTWQLTFHKFYYLIYGPILIGSFLLLDFELALALFWAPIAIVFQFESFVNTWLHSWNKDIPVNNHLVQLFVGGEAYHHNHHQKPGDFRFGKYDLVGLIGEKFIK